MTHEEHLFRRNEACLSLQKLVEKSSVLPPEKFNYVKFVTATDQKGCGTVCCLAGWYPKWFPEAGIEWECFNSSLSMLIDGKIQKFHGISKTIVDAIFYGMKLKDDQKSKIIVPDILLSDAQNTPEYITKRIRIIQQSILAGELDKQLL